MTWEKRAKKSEIFNPEIVRGTVSSFPGVFFTRLIFASRKSSSFISAEDIMVVVKGMRCWQLKGFMFFIQHRIDCCAILIKHKGSRGIYRMKILSLLEKKLRFLFTWFRPSWLSESSTSSARMSSR